MVVPTDPDSQSSAEQTVTVPKVVKIVLLGNAGVGKTALLTRFTRDVFQLELASTIGVEFATQTLTTSSGHQVKLQIWDTAGQERFRSFSPAYYRGVLGVLLVYDVTDRDSYVSVTSRWLPQVVENCSEGVSTVVVGNKSDLIQEGGEHFAADSLGDLGGVGVVASLEASSSTGQGVDKAFQVLTESIVEKIQLQNNVIRGAAKVAPALSKPRGNEAGARKGKSKLCLIL